MTIWMLQSKKKFVAGIFMGVIGLLIITSAIGNMIDKHSDDNTKEEYQTLEEFKSKYMNTESEQQSQSQITKPITASSHFIDTTGYTPKWAKDIGPEQIEAKCTSIMLDLDQLFNNDYKWCDEFMGYLLDKMNGQVEKIKNDQGYFVDTTGYIPEWAKGIGESQASLKCSNIMLKGTGDNSENNWCMEYLGNLLDKQN